MAEDLPYKCEYSKSNRAGCRLCHEKIESGVLRLAYMAQVTIKLFFASSLRCVRNHIFCLAYQSNRLHVLLIPVWLFM